MITYQKAVLQVKVWCTQLWKPRPSLPNSITINQPYITLLYYFDCV